MNSSRHRSSSLRGLCPPLVLELFRRFAASGIHFSGTYSCWSDALSSADGYDSHAILTQAAAATGKVVSGQAQSERDGVTFDHALHPYPLLAALLMAASENEGRLTVLDFGGALGSTYFQCRDYLHSLKRLHWCVVEQPHYVDAGRQQFASDRLKFFRSMSEVWDTHEPDVVLFSSSLQYLAEPRSVLEQAFTHRPPYIVVDRTPFIAGNNSLISRQIVPKRIVESSYPVWLFSETEFMRWFDDTYTAIAAFDAVDGIIGRGRLKAEFKGLVFRKK